MKSLITFLLLIVSLRSFAENMPDSSSSFSKRPASIEGEVTVLPAHQTWMKVSNNPFQQYRPFGANDLTEISISGKAAERIYQDMQVKDKNFTSVTGTLEKGKVSSDKNIICSKSKEGYACRITINAKTGNGYWSSSSQDIAEPCKSISNNDRNDIPEKNRSSEKPSKGPVGAIQN